jgi:hypothetical protein
MLTSEQQQLGYAPVIIHLMNDEHADMEADMKAVDARRSKPTIGQLHKTDF